ncbi:3-ketoacyl-(acyl-carrier-protein) reductase, partial [mine drainage metagenome]
MARGMHFIARIPPMMMNTLIAGTGGLGINIAYLLLKRGDSVVVTTRSLEKGARIEKELSSFGKICNIAVDPSTDQGVNEMFEKASAQFGKVDNLIVTVGGYASDSIENPAHLNEMLESHLTIPLNMLKHFPKFAISKGSVVLISSIQSIYTSNWNLTSYILGKNSLNKLVELAAAQLLNKDIRVNAVA